MRERQAVPPAFVHGVLFVALGLALAPLRSAPASDASAQLGVVAATGAFLVVGAATARLLGIGEGGFCSPFHRILLGQIGLITWFYLRSLASHALGVPGVTRGELLGLVAVLLGAAIHRHLGSRRADPGRRERGEVADGAKLALLWAVWWASTIWYLGLRSGELATPSSDPDAHAYMAKLAAWQGQVPYDHLPWSPDRLTYPSGFSVLNAIWMQLAGLTPVQVANLQVAIQACLAVGLVLECALAMRERVSLGAGLLLLAAAHFVFVFPGNGEAPWLQGTPRLAHTAFAILFLCHALRPDAVTGSRAAARAAGAFVGAFCVAWSVTTNPAQAVVVAPLVLVGGLLLWRESSALPPGDAASLRSSRRVAAAAVVVPLLVVASDGWLPTLLPPPADPLAPPLPRPPWELELGWGTLESVADWLGPHTLLGVVPDGCLIGPHCPGYLVGLVRAVPLALGVFAVGTLLAVRARRLPRDARPGGVRLRHCALAVLAVLAATWLAIAACGLIEGVLPRPVTRNMTQLRDYAVNGLRYMIPLLFLLLVGLGLAAAAGSWSRLLAGASRLPRLSGDAAASAALLAGIAALAARNPELPATAWRSYLREASVVAPSLGPIEPADLAFLRDARRVVPPGERVLLPGIVAETRHELWNYALASSRALPLYTDIDFAFFLGLGPTATSALAYRARVCESFDVAWLREHGVRWVFASESALELGACLFNWREVRRACFEERLRRGDRSLYRLSESCDPGDPRLRPPVGSASRSGVGRGVVGFVDACGYGSVQGWACDRGSDRPVTVALEVGEGEDALVPAYYRANLEREPEVARRCGTHGSAHGFDFRPSGLRPGSHAARVVAYGGTAESPRELAACRLVVPLAGPETSRAAAGSGPLGYVDACRVGLIEGWACDAGSDAAVTIEVALESDFGGTSSSFYVADGEREGRVAQRCGSRSSHHGFRLAPPRPPAGSYRARVFAYDARAERSRELASCTVVYAPE